MVLGVKKEFSNKMVARKEKFKNKLLISFVLAFIVSLIIYFTFRNNYAWIPLIIPEFLGVSLLAILITFSLKKTTKFTTFLFVLLVIIVAGVVGFIYGRINEIRFLIDLSPELLGSTGLGLVFSIIFKKKIFQ